MTRIIPSPKSHAEPLTRNTNGGTGAGAGKPAHRYRLTNGYFKRWKSRPTSNWGLSPGCQILPYRLGALAVLCLVAVGRYHFGGNYDGSCPLSTKLFRTLDAIGLAGGKRAVVSTRG
jgi:hypothetical protein